MTGSHPAPQNIEAEQSVLGAVLLIGSAVLEPLQTEIGLRPEHFYRPAHGVIYRAMLELADQDAPVDVLTLTAHLETTGRLKDAGGKAAVDALAAAPPVMHNAGWYGRIVAEEHKWRAWLQSTYEQQHAIINRDEDAFHAARTDNPAVGRGSDRDLTAEDAALHFMEWYQDTGSPTAIPLPFDRLNEMFGGGLRPGDTTILAGWTSMGKSCLADQILHHAALHGFAGWAYLNEMSTVDRTARTLARMSGVSFERIYNRTLTGQEWKTLTPHLRELPFGMTECSGWSAEDIARHVRRHRRPLAIVDLVTRIPAEKTSDWDRVSGVLTDAARQSGTHLILVCQLNNARYTSVCAPPPTRRDLRNTGAWAQDAPNILFVHRDQEEVEEMPVTLDHGHIRADKVRNGRPGAMGIEFNPARMRFEIPPPELRSVA